MAIDATFTAADRVYIESTYATLESLCAERSESPEEVRALIQEGALPRPTYVVDGQEMFPPDYFALVDEAGGVDRLRGHFFDAYRREAAARGVPLGDAETDSQGYLSGQFGICLWSVTPAAMTEKTRLIAAITALVDHARPDDRGWIDALGSAVDALDELERPFTDYDRRRWGGTSRQTYIDDVRATYLNGTRGITSLRTAFPAATVTSS